MEVVSLQGMRKELEGLKKELVPECRPMKVLLQTKAKDMMNEEIDKVLSEVPIQEVPTDVIVSFLDRDIDRINEYLVTSFKSIADMPSEMFSKYLEMKDN